MLELFYQTLGTVGYRHPVHPALIHIVIGMVSGAFIFGLVSWVRGRAALALTARHCILLALVGLFPAALFGYVDWQYYYAGSWLLEIKMKLILAFFLLVVLSIAITFRSSAERGSIHITLIYSLCLLTVIALGYFGGELVYGSRTKAPLPETLNVEAGKALFTTNCSACHPDGGNTLKVHLPLKKAPQLKDFNTFLAYIRNPQARDGSQTTMPPFGAEKVSEENALQLYHYIIQTLQE